MTQCKAIIEFADDYGDNRSTFHCQLEEGHDGLHSEKGAMGREDDMPYTLTWEGTVEKVHVRCKKCGNEQEIDKYIWDAYYKDRGGMACFCDWNAYYELVK